MDAMIHCTACSQQLRVPQDSSGRRARCPACGVVFVIPAPEDLVEETFSTWIEQEVDRRHDELEELFEQQLNPNAAAAAGAAEGASDSRGRVVAAVKMRPHDRRIAEDSAKPSPEHGRDTTTSEHEQVEHARRRTAEAVERLGGAEVNASEVVRSAEPRPAEPEVSQADEPGPGGEPPEQARSYPQQLVVTQPAPHLVVLRCDHLGVRFGFDARWLADRGFAISLPVRCVFSGMPHRDQLIARPLVFNDRTRGKKASVADLATRQEHRVLGDRTPRELAKLMGRLEGLPYPFNFAVPYYVSTRFAHMYLHCETRDRSDGGITCEVLVPDASTALEWLARVNGVCGQDYEMLEREASLLHGEAWRALSDSVRQRLAVWCKLRPREVLRLYLSDADFGRNDDGLAGLAVTDQRLIYCKYHHRGQVPIDAEGAAVFARCDERFAELTLHAGGERARMVKLHREGLSQLVKLLRDGGGLRISVGHAG